VNLVLIGYRGTGKSVIARGLGVALGWPVHSLDAEIVEAAGMSIPDFVAAKGWPAFRDLEEELVARAASRRQTVIDCGGGVVEREGNFARLRGAGPVVWLQASVPTIVARIGGDTQRPSLTGKSFTEEVQEVLTRRAPLYQRMADHLVQTDARSVEDLVSEILRLTSARLGIGG